jgi:arylsulfatase A-like enzyme
LFGDVVEEIDWSVGEVMRTLNMQGLDKNTLVVFTSDNGPWLTFGNHAGNAGGLREGKATSWEGGLRVPCIMRWPGKIAQGKVCNEISSTIDLLPTIVSITKATAPTHKIDGVNILPLLIDETNITPRDEFAYYYEANNLKAIRKGQWKLVFPSRSLTYRKTVMGHDGWPGKSTTDSVKLALYDLSTDPGETADVKDQHTDIVEKLNVIADKYRKELGDNLTKQKGEGVRPPAKVTL